MAITRRSLQYQYFKSSAVERLEAAMSLGLFTPDLADKISHEVWIEILDRMNDCPHCMLRLAQRMGFKEDL